MAQLVALPEKASRHSRVDKKAEQAPATHLAVLGRIAVAEGARDDEEQRLVLQAGHVVVAHAEDLGVEGVVEDLGEALGEALRLARLARVQDGALDPLGQRLAHQLRRELDGARNVAEVDLWYLVASF